jgi:hypothetical protein
MATVFSDMHGVLLLQFSPPNETLNSAAYQASLKKLKECYSTQEASDVRQEGAAVA